MITRRALALIGVVWLIAVAIAHGDPWWIAAIVAFCGIPVLGGAKPDPARRIELAALIMATLATPKQPWFALFAAPVWSEQLRRVDPVPTARRVAAVCVIAALTVAVAWAAPPTSVTTTAIPLVVAAWAVPAAFAGPAPTDQPITRAVVALMLAAAGFLDGGFRIVTAAAWTGLARTHGKDPTAEDVRRVGFSIGLVFAALSVGALAWIGAIPAESPLGRLRLGLLAAYTSTLALSGAIAWRHRPRRA